MTPRRRRGNRSADDRCPVVRRRPERAAAARRDDRRQPGPHRRAVPASEALVDCATGRRWTYRELDAAVDALALGLLDLDLAAGDRVGIWAPNCAEWVLVQYATARVGVVLVNINPAYRTHELAFVLNQSGCRVLLSAPEFKTSSYVDMVDAVRDEVSGLETVILPWQPGVGSAGQRGRIRRVGSGVGPGRPQLSPDDPINIQYTSGTTGFPKGATLSHHNILNNGFFIGEGCRYTEVDRVCIPVPFYHCFGMVLGNLAVTTHGACIVIPAPGFDPASTLQRCRPSGVRRCMAYRRCSLRSSRFPTSRRTT